MPQVAEEEQFLDLPQLVKERSSHRADVSQVTKDVDEVVELIPQERFVPRDGEQIVGSSSGSSYWGDAGSQSGFQSACSFLKRGKKLWANAA